MPTTPPSPPLVSPLSPSPPPSHSDPFNPLRQHYHHYSQATDAETSLQTRRQQRRQLQQRQQQNNTQPTDFLPPISPLPPLTDSPTLGHFSPISILSPLAGIAPTRNYTTTTTSRTQRAPPTRRGTVYLQDHIPFQHAKPASAAGIPTYPPKTVVPTLATEPSLTRPITLYLADRHPHRIAHAPFPIPTRDTDVEMQAASRRGNGGRDGERTWEQMGAKYQRTRKRNNWLIAVATVVGLSGFAVFLVWGVRSGKAGG